MQRRSWFVAPAIGALILAAPLLAQAGTTTASPAPAAAKPAPVKATPATPAMAAPAQATHEKSAPAKASPAHASAAAAPAKPAASAPVDLNSASREELEKLPGIGEAIAAKIVAGRPFKAKSDLVSRGIVNQDQYAKLAPHVIAKQAPVAK